MTGDHQWKSMNLLLRRGWVMGWGCFCCSSIKGNIEVLRLQKQGTSSRLVFSEFPLNCARCFMETTIDRTLWNINNLLGHFPFEYRSPLTAIRLFDWLLKITYAFLISTEETQQKMWSIKLWGTSASFLLLFFWISSWFYFILLNAWKQMGINWGHFLSVLLLLSGTASATHVDYFKVKV